MLSGMGMAKGRDARHLAPDAQEALRRRAVMAIREGMGISEAARVFKVSRMAIYKWLARVEEGDLRSLKSRKRGRPPESRLQPHQVGTAVRMITARCPDQLMLPFALWTREAVADLLERRFGVRVSIWTAGRYLRSWGFTPQKPVRRAYERDERAVRRWLTKDYPAIRALAKRLGAEIHWLDEMGVRSDHQAGRSYAPKGETPAIPGTGQRFGCNMISTVTNKGVLAFMVFTGRFTARVFLRFLRRLLRHRPVKLFVIADSHPVHKAARVKQWLQAHHDRIQLHFLPPYSPDLNPDELLNHDVKSNAVGRRRPETQADLMKNVRGYLRSTQRRPDIVQAYFQQEDVAYAAG
jgi:transposase